MTTIEERVLERINWKYLEVILSKASFESFKRHISENVLEAISLAKSETIKEFFERIEKLKLDDAIHEHYKDEIMGTEDVLSKIIDYILSKLKKEMME